jgi:hypothetical protein
MSWPSLQCAYKLKYVSVGILKADVAVGPHLRLFVKNPASCYCKMAFPHSKFSHVYPYRQVAVQLVGICEEDVLHLYVSGQ